MSLFFIDQIEDKKISWDQLLNDVKKKKSLDTNIRTNDYYQILQNIVISLLEDIQITLFDPDDNNLSFQKKEKIKLKKINYPLSKTDFINRITSNKNWSINLFTSGTTGTPKLVNHNLSSINRFLKIHPKMSSNIWGLAYNPTHIAGIQVIMQAVYNGNTIVRLFGLSKKKIFKQINQHLITHISATPTFYRMLFPHKKRYKSIIRITSGGEAFNINMKKNINSVFPNAKITNVYASTEAGSIFASDGEYFRINDKIKDLIRLKNNQIELHYSLLGKFENNSIKNKKWYKTGDLVEIHKSNSLLFKIISRESDLINVGGLNVNPVEVENIINAIDGVLNARIRSRKNSITGNILICDLVVNKITLTESYIKKYLKDFLPKYKIPQIINFKKEIILTRTGKTSRL